MSKALVLRFLSPRCTQVKNRDHQWMEAKMNKQGLYQ